MTTTVIVEILSAHATGIPQDSYVMVGDERISVCRRLPGTWELYLINVSAYSSIWQASPQIAIYSTCMQLKGIVRICGVLPQTPAETPDHAFITNGLDYNAVMSWCMVSLGTPSHSCGGRRTRQLFLWHILATATTMTPTMKTPHWLPDEQHINLKVLTVTYIPCFAWPCADFLTCLTWWCRTTRHVAWAQPVRACRWCLCPGCDPLGIGSLRTRLQHCGMLFRRLFAWRSRWLVSEVCWKIHLFYRFRTMAES